MIPRVFKFSIFVGVLFVSMALQSMQPVYSPSARSLAPERPSITLTNELAQALRRVTLHTHDGDGVNGVGEIVPFTQVKLPIDRVSGLCTLCVKTKDKCKYAGKLCCWPTTMSCLALAPHQVTGTIVFAHNRKCVPDEEWHTGVLDLVAGHCLMLSPALSSETTWLPLYCNSEGVPVHSVTLDGCAACPSGQTESECATTCCTQKGGQRTCHLWSVPYHKSTGPHSLVINAGTQDYYGWTIPILTPLSELMLSSNRNRPERPDLTLPHVSQYIENTRVDVDYGYAHNALMDVVGYANQHMLTKCQAVRALRACTFAPSAYQVLDVCKHAHAWWPEYAEKTIERVLANPANSKIVSEFIHEHCRERDVLSRFIALRAMQHFVRDHSEWCGYAIALASEHASDTHPWLMQEAYQLWEALAEVDAAAAYTAVLDAYVRGKPQKEIATQCANIVAILLGGKKITRAEIERLEKIVIARGDEDMARFLALYRDENKHPLIS